MTGQHVDPKAVRVTFAAFYAEWAARQVWKATTVLAMDLAQEPAQRLLRPHAGARGRQRRDAQARGSAISPDEVIAMQLASDQWDFAVPGSEDRPVQGLLEIAYRELADHILPTAERPMSAA